MSALREEIDGLRAGIVACMDTCGICHDLSRGILHRSLYLQRPDAKGRGCLAVGLNPGRSRKAERLFYLGTQATYGRAKEYCELPVDKDHYFKRTRSIIDQLGLHRPIIWSYFAKCENATDRKEPPPIQTMRHCAGRFLHRELKVTPRNWVVLGVGRVAFSALAYLVPERGVIGIPHPTGGYRDFRKMLEGARLRQEQKDRVAAALFLRDRAERGLARPEQERRMTGPGSRWRPWGCWAQVVTRRGRPGCNLGPGRRGRRLGGVGGLVLVVPLEPELHP
jgi:hypothetical protein